MAKGIHDVIVPAMCSYPYCFVTKELELKGDKLYCPNHCPDKIGKVRPIFSDVKLSKPLSRILKDDYLAEHGKIEHDGSYVPIDEVDRMLEFAYAKGLAQYVDENQGILTKTRRVERLAIRDKFAEIIVNVPLGLHEPAYNCMEQAYQKIFGRHYKKDYPDLKPTNPEAITYAEKLRKKGEMK